MEGEKGTDEKGDDEMNEEYQDDEWDNYLVWEQRCNDVAEKQYEQEQKEKVRP